MKILAALDGSEAGYNAMKSACRISQKTGSSVTAFYVNKGEEYSPEVTGWTSIKERIAKELETFGHEVIHKAYEIGRTFDVRVEGMISDGIPAREILKYISSHGIIKLIAAGHSSKGRGAREFVESTTRSLVAQSEIPVLVTSSEIEIRNVLIAVDNSEASGKAVSFGGRLAKSLGADASLVSFVPESEALVNEYRLIADVPNIDKHIEAYEKVLKEGLDKALASAEDILMSVGVSIASVSKKVVSSEILPDLRNHDLLVIGMKRDGSHNRLDRFLNKLLATSSVTTVFVQ